MPRVLLATPFRLAHSEQEERTARLRNLLETSGGRAEVYSYDGLGLRGIFGSLGRVGSIGRFLENVLYCHGLVDKILRHHVLHVVVSSGVSSIWGIVPVALLGRFFGRRVIVDLRDAPCQAELDESNRLVRAILRLCDDVLVSSDCQVQQADGLSIRGEYIAAAVDVGRIKPRVITSIQPTIIVAGRLEAINNIPCAIRAFKLVKQKYPRTEMIVVGSGSQNRKLQAKVSSERLHGVTFVETSDQELRRSCFAKADLYVNCCSIDHLPGALVEALAFGLPVVSTPAGGIRDALEDRRQALLFKANDHVGLADRIIELVENPKLAESLSRQARVTAAKYDWAIVRKRWLAFYTDRRCS